MLEWFTESAFFPSCIGILMTIAFIGLAVSSGEMLMLRIALAIAALTALLIIIEVMIVTDKEQIENTLKDMAAAMQKNDIDHVLDYLATPELVSRAKGHLREDATCHSCVITAINQVTVNDTGQSATADFVAFARASDRRFPNPVPIQRRIKLHFEKQQNRWKVVDFEQADPRAGISP